MDQDKKKEQEFKVTDKRSAFREETAEDSSQAESTRSPVSESSAGPSETESTAASADSRTSPPLPEADLMTLIFSLYTHAQVTLGIIPDPMTRKQQQDLSQAKYHIDLLGVLQEKTRGNLTPEEDQTLEQLLFDLRMVYLELSKS